jgi:hypothetical protein
MHVSHYAFLQLCTLFHGTAFYAAPIFDTRRVCFLGGPTCVI